MFQKYSLYLAIVFLLPACYLTDPANSSSGTSSSSFNFYAHCENNPRTTVVDVEGNTGIAASSDGTPEQDGLGTLSENTNFCQSDWGKVNIQPTLNGTNEGLSIYTAGTSLVILNLDFTPYQQNPSAGTWQTTAIIESGALYGLTLNCTIYSAHFSQNPCPSNLTTFVGCPNLNFQVCSGQ